MALFAPFRALGYICDDVPFAVQRRGRETFVTVSVGKAWQIYNTAKLTLALVGPQLHHSISALACKGDLTFAAVRGVIVECKRVHRSGEYRGHTGDILQLLVLGDHLLSLGCDRQLLVWRIGDYSQPAAAISLPDGFEPTCMAHPDTYLNKVVVGSEDGRLQLWNFSSGKQLYEVAGLGSAVRCIEPSPALDVVGIGLQDGRAVLHNLRYDEQVTQFINASGAGTNAERFLAGSAAHAAARAAGGACTSLAFRTGPGLPLMAAGGAAGVVTVWDLEQRKLATVLRDAHDAGLTSLHFFAGEPRLMSAAGDNSLKQWVFDSADGSPRLLRFRSGHAAPPTVVRHYGDGKRLLSAGQDRAFRVFSTIQDQQSRELSQKHIQQRAKRLKVEEQELKLGRVVALDACDVRERDWSNVITAHEDDPAAYVWRLQHFTLGEFILVPPPKEMGSIPQAPVTAVALSRCGNFAFVGTAAGRVDRYNMQSGMHRGVYTRPAAPRAAPAAAAQQRGRRAIEPPPVGPTTTAHDGSVTGVAADACNRLVVSGGQDGVLRIWDFKSRQLQSELLVGCGVARMAHHPGTGLLATAGTDNVIRMFDVEARRLVRQFKGHADRISDLQLSEDCRWLLSSSMDNTVRVWDIPAARTLQVMRLGSPVTALSLSPAMDLLATCHVERRGIYLWSNQLLFGSGADVVPSDKPVNVRLPSLGAGREQLAAALAEQRSKQQQTVDAMEEVLGRTTAGGGRKAAAAADESGEEGGGGNSRSSSSDAEAGTNFEAGFSSDDSDAFMPSGSEAEDDTQQQQQDGEAAQLEPRAAAAAAAYAARDAAGAPAPLLPELVTLSMLPRTQWQNLVHLDTIKARNKPIEPPKKPAAAPFFLPTVAGANAGRQPVFAGQEEQPQQQGDEETAEPPSADIVAAAAAAWGSGDEAEEGQQQGQQPGEAAPGSAMAAAAAAQRAGGSRVLRRYSQAERSRLVELLERCGASGDWSSLVAHLRGLPPVQVDSELRALQVLEPQSPSDEELAALELLLSFLEAETAANTNFEFVQALLRVTLAVHGDAIAVQPALLARAQRLRARLAASWRRVDSLMQSVRCTIGFLGNLQA